jgi:hypothetical protein
MADDLNNTNTCWLGFAQSLAWLRQSRPGTTDEWASNKLQQALIEELCGVSESVPIDKFRYPWSGRMVDLVVLLKNNYLTLADIRWQNVECNLNWLNRDWPLPALEAEATPTPAADAAPKPIGPAAIELAPTELPTTEASVTEPEPAARAEESKPGPASNDVSTPNTEALTTEVAEASQEKHPGGASPVWDWKGMIALLQQRKAGKGSFKDKTTFRNVTALKHFIQTHVQRVNGANRGNGPNPRTVDRAITTHKLEQYATFEE